MPNYTLGYTGAEVEELLDGIGTQTYTEDNYVTDAETLTASIDALDMALKDRADAITTLNTEMEERTTYGVYTGLVVARQTSADMTVKVSAGTIYMADGTRYTPSATATLAVTAAYATNPRIDIVYVASNGTVTYLAGTAAATPVQPTTPAGGMLLATILVTAGKTSILTADITLRRKMMWVEDWIIPTLLNSWVKITTNDVRYMKDAFGFVHIRGEIMGGTNAVEVFTLPVGYRPGWRTMFSQPASVSSAGNPASVSIANTGVLTVNVGASALLGEIIFKAV